MPSSCVSSATRPARALPRALEVIVELRVLELMQIERGRVLHDADADAIREQVAEQSLDEGRRAREQLTADDGAHFDGDEHPQMPRATHRRASR